MEPVVKQTAAKTKVATSRLSATERNYLELPTALIDPSPFQYRKVFDQESLNAFAQELTVHGIIQNLTVRPAKNGRYELVAGERRYRAAEIAGIDVVPVLVRELTDEEVIEIQLSENIQRENPHPLHEAQGIVQLQAIGRDIEEISKRLGRSKAYIVKRIKLYDLIPSMQDVFLSGLLNINQAFEVASLDAQSQNDLYETTFAGSKGINMYNFNAIVGRYKRDLRRAPFNIEDNKLIESRGACTACPFNTAYFGSLFPDLAEAATCTNKSCFNQKCDQHFHVIVAEALSKHTFQAIIRSYDSSHELLKMLSEHPETAALPVMGKHSVNILTKPVKPNKKNFNITIDGEQPHFDQEFYDRSLQEYNEDKEAYEHLIASGEAILAAEITSTIKVVYLTKSHVEEAAVTAKEVQEAIKAGNATPDLLRREITRIKDREVRKKQIDREKVQLKIHEHFSEQNTSLESIDSLTPADVVAARYLIYYSLDHGARHKINTVLFNIGNYDRIGADKVFKKMASLTDQQHSFLIRTALSSIGDTKQPGTEAGNMLREVAGASGIDIKLIQNEQKVIATDRDAKATERIIALEAMITEMENEQSENAS